MDKSRYFGPYTSAGAVKDTIELLRKLYQLRTCNRSLPKDTGKERPCLNYHIHQCLAPCQGYITPEEYNKRIRKAMGFLNGDFQPVIRELEEKMNRASENLEFEKAIEYRELLNSVRAVAQKQKITSADGEDRDVMALAMDQEDAVVQVFFVRGGKLIGREHFHISIATEDTKEQVLETFSETVLRRHALYSQGNHAPMSDPGQQCHIGLADPKERPESIYKDPPKKGVREKTGGAGRGKRPSGAQTGQRKDQEGRGADHRSGERDRFPSSSGRNPADGGL